MNAKEDEKLTLVGLFIDMAMNLNGSLRAYEWGGQAHGSNSHWRVTMASLSPRETGQNRRVPLCEIARIFPGFTTHVQARRLGNLDQEL